MRTIRTIAQEIQRDWKQPCFEAVPYLEAMLTLDTIDDRYGADDARSIVAYFLNNASAWKGPVARRIKIELKQMLAEKRR